MKKQYYSININGLTIQNLEPLKFGHTILKEKVPFYQSGMLGRLITVDGNNPTNTLEEAENWLENVAKKHPNLDFLKQEVVPYVDMETLHPLQPEEVKHLTKDKTRKHFTFYSKNKK